MIFLQTMVFLLIILVILLSLAAYMFKEALRTPIKRPWVIERPEWEGKQLNIACIADLHAGWPVMPLIRVRKIVDQVNALENIDMIVLLGDYRVRYFFRTTWLPLSRLADELARLKAPLGVYGILGNHDWWDDKEAMRVKNIPCITEALFRDAGITMLENQSITIGGRFNLIGLGDQWAFSRTGEDGVDDLAKAMAQIDPDLPNILLAHEPDIFPDVPENIGVTLSGHTHGGQVVFFGEPVATESKYGVKYIYGHINEFGRDLIVSAGLGASVLPFRLGRPPEITIVEIR